MYFLKISILVIYFIFSVVSPNIYISDPVKQASQNELLSNYKELLFKFPIDEQGAGIEPGTSINIGTTQQPMTYGLILSAESRHYQIDRNNESKIRISKALRWLLDNADADNDGELGWGLPESWDAFQDGTINPENHPYTITTAIAMNGLLDTLSIKDYLDKEQEQAVLNVLKEVSLRWCNEVWFDDKVTGYGYFAYSPGKDDQFDLPNSSSMLMGSLARLISEHGDICNETELNMIKSRVDKAANELINKVQMENGVPMWNYISVPNTLNSVKINDLVHHSYTIYGLEMYRLSEGTVPLPWSKEDALKSFDMFWKDGKIYDFPQNREYEGKQVSFKAIPARLWGVGMMVAVFGQLEQFKKAEDSIKYIKSNYGDFPELTFWPLGYSDDKTFYPRLAAHVLFGISTTLR